MSVSGSTVGDPARVTRGQMDAWARSFENWADCDTACFKLFDRVSFAWDKAARRLAGSDDASSRWVGRTALRELTRRR